MSDGRASCIFCRIVDRAAEASYVAEEEDVVAFMDVRPINEGHALVVPREHHAALADVPDATAVALWSLARRVAAALRESGLRCEGINLFVADGEAAGQEVPHAHLHVMPRWQGDGFGFRFPERYHDTPPRKALDEAAARIRARL